MALFASQEALWDGRFCVHKGDIHNVPQNKVSAKAGQVS